MLWPLAAQGSGLFSEKEAPRLILDILGLGLLGLKAVRGALLPAFRSGLSQLGLEIVPFPTQKDIEALAGMTLPKDLPFIISSPAEFLEKPLPRVLKKK